MSIQWFPGHMNTARKEAAKTMEVIDVIVELLDARIPEASCNPLIEELRLASGMRASSTSTMTSITSIVLAASLRATFM